MLPGVLVDSFQGQQPQLNAPSTPSEEIHLSNSASRSFYLAQPIVSRTSKRLFADAFATDEYLSDSIHYRGMQAAAKSDSAENQLMGDKKLKRELSVTFVHSSADENRDEGGSRYHSSLWNSSLAAKYLEGPTPQFSLKPAVFSPIPSKILISNGHHQHKHWSEDSESSDSEHEYQSNSSSFTHGQYSEHPLMDDHLQDLDSLRDTLEDVPLASYPTRHSSPIDPRLSGPHIQDPSYSSSIYHSDTMDSGTSSLNDPKKTTDGSRTRKAHLEVESNAPSLKYRGSQLKISGVNTAPASSGCDNGGMHMRSAHRRRFGLVPSSELETVSTHTCSPLPISLGLDSSESSMPGTMSTSDTYNERLSPAIPLDDTSNSTCLDTPDDIRCAAEVESPTDIVPPLHSSKISMMYSGAGPSLSLIPSLNVSAASLQRDLSASTPMSIPLSNTHALTSSTLSDSDLAQKPLVMASTLDLPSADDASRIDLVTSTSSDPVRANSPTHQSLPPPPWANLPRQPLLSPLPNTAIKQKQKTVDVTAPTSTDVITSSGRPVITYRLQTANPTNGTFNVVMKEDYMANFIQEKAEKGKAKTWKKDKDKKKQEKHRQLLLDDGSKHEVGAQGSIRAILSSSNSISTSRSPTRGPQTILDVHHASTVIMCSESASRDIEKEPEPLTKAELRRLANIHKAELKAEQQQQKRHELEEKAIAAKEAKEQRERERANTRAAKAQKRMEKFEKQEKAKRAAELERNQRENEMRELLALKERLFEGRGHLNHMHMQDLQADNHIQTSGPGQSITIPANAMDASQSTQHPSDTQFRGSDPFTTEHSNVGVPPAETENIYGFRIGQEHLSSEHDQRQQATWGVERGTVHEQAPEGTTGMGADSQFNSATSWRHNTFTASVPTEEIVRQQFAYLSALGMYSADATWEIKELGGDV
ncbi:hypothetical protein J3R30DRAFT_745138 [Lentinula aciculospora]|uniref:Uncharacterized protein n=1 Tax=Lentinula aciculospora TaxID=153920 RepID=A0A9W9DJX2_9AGAR|nr:hypothetical protein J3R30DRAFT_745138 [Lentinula aciculospora]